MKNDEFQYRQGDVYLFRVDKLPEGLSVEESFNGRHQALAFGESTGHAHCINKEDCLLFPANDNLRRLAKQYGVTDDRAVKYGLRIVVDNTTLRHGTPAHGFTDPDHTPIDLPAGDYIVMIPREYSDEDEFKVITD